MLLETLADMEPCREFVSAWWQVHPPVGTFISFLALLGVLVPLYREWGKIGRREKAVWTAVMFALLLLELRTLYLDRDEHDRQQEYAQCQQLHSFQSIADTLKSSITTAQGQYQSTITHVDGVLVKTQEVAGVAKKNLDAITGGDSFGYVIPSLTDRGDPIAMLTHNDGNQPLTVQVRLMRLTDTCATWGKVTDCSEKFDSQTSFLDGGVVAPHTRTRAPLTIPPPSPAGDLYLIQVRGQNGTAREHIWLKPSNGESGTAFRFQVEWIVTGKPRKGDRIAAGEMTRMLMKKNWKDIEPNPKQP
jgi:hypothetical protein